MKAFITSIGEATTDLCEWSLKRNGFDVEVIYNETSSLAQKLEYIYTIADYDFVRVDADVIPNRKLTPESISKDQLPYAVWYQFKCFDWFQQDIIFGGIQLYKKAALTVLRQHIGEHLDDERPETSMWRLKEFYEPRKCLSSDMVLGIHGYGQTDIGRIKQTKVRRGQSDGYDWELAEKLSTL